MKKIFFLCCLVSVSVSFVWGQQPISNSIRVSTTAQAPESNIDVLKQSLKTSQRTDSVVGTSDKKTAITKNDTAQIHDDTLVTSLETNGEVKNVQTAVAPVVKPRATKNGKITLTNQQNKSSVPVQITQTIQEQPISPNVSVTQTVNSSQADLEEKMPFETISQNTSEEDAADAELEYAIKMMEQSKAKAQAERTIPPSAAQNKPNKVPAPNKKFNPNAYRPNVTWLSSKSTHFDIYTQKRDEGIPSSNMSMTFENSYQTLRRFIPWMMSGRVRVFIYQDHKSYLRHEPNAKAWTRAVAYPTRGEIVVYDEPGKQQELREVFTHELTHIFTQQFFDSHKTGRIMTPTWLDEGLAVLMEDQSGGLKAGPWANDLKMINFQRDPADKAPDFGSNSLFGTSFSKNLKPKKHGKPIYFISFESFMQENSLQAAESRNQVQNWYTQAYAMVRFLLNPAGSSSPSNRMQFEQFTRLIAQGEPKRDAKTGFLIKDSRGKTMYEPYSVEKALGRAFRYNTLKTFETNFWMWMDKQ